MTVSEFFDRVSPRLSVISRVGASDVVMTGLADDSRAVRPGRVFVAVKGEKVDGHRYLDQAVKAGDIAVLVRTGAEGKLVQQELARLAIASVYLSNRESVLEQTEAREILLILHELFHLQNCR